MGYIIVHPFALIEPYNEMKKKNISTESVMYDCQQLQLIYQIHRVKNDNDYT